MIEVIKPGLWTCIQDLGRSQYRNYGVPVSGSMDQHSAKMANLILKNPFNAPVLEITLQGPDLKFLKATTIAICGCAFEQKLNNKEVNRNELIKINAGDVLTFEQALTGSRIYLAVAGGFKSETILKSQSWYMGITKNVRLKKGDTLHFDKEYHESNPTQLLSPPDYGSDLLSVFQGPEYDLLNKEQISLLKEDFTIGVNDRMGYRLKELVPNQFESMLSSPVLPGTVQLTPSGKLIILMRDCQTTGGYPRILQLDEDAINVLAQKRIGDTIRFDLLRPET